MKGSRLSLEASQQGNIPTLENWVCQKCVNRKNKASRKASSHPHEHRKPALAPSKSVIIKQESSTKSIVITIDDSDEPGPDGSDSDEIQIIEPSRPSVSGARKVSESNSKAPPFVAFPHSLEEEHKCTPPQSSTHVPGTSVDLPAARRQSKSRADSEAFSPTQPPRSHSYICKPQVKPAQSSTNTSYIPADMSQASPQLKSKTNPDTFHSSMTNSTPPHSSNVLSPQFRMSTQTSHDMNARSHSPRSQFGPTRSTSYVPMGVGPRSENSPNADAFIMKPPQQHSSDFLEPQLSRNSVVKQEVVEPEPQPKLLTRGARKMSFRPPSPPPILPVDLFPPMPTPPPEQLSARPLKLVNSIHSLRNLTMMDTNGISSVAQAPFDPYALVCPEIRSWFGNDEEQTLSQTVKGVVARENRRKPKARLFDSEKYNPELLNFSRLGLATSPVKLES
ncbi:hypothetical protein BDP27DRAFT_1413311 [Rhodocollybia butyracea]|uniref:Uncharacterized protein n=1 Tax=Rhodocollybia butyracea TaxID=206335 RepID=A0A9P5Q3T5_9AGAR|nr:hypothetical protein BDP27DRAFT_1413311 [Rhodocollybia butyracea]